MKRIGECVQCGACCVGHTIVFFPDEDTDLYKKSQDDYVKWLASHKGVRVRVTNTRVEATFKAPCYFLRWKYSFDFKRFRITRKSYCKIYKNRFDICKRFPEEPTPRCKGFNFNDENEN